MATVEPTEATTDNDMTGEDEDPHVVDMGEQWTQPQPEILPLIARKLPDLRDFVRFRAVCTTWRASTTTADTPPQLPWVLERRRRGQLQPGPRFRFFSHSAGRVYGVSGGGSSWVLASGVCRGSVVAMADLSRTVMYNPFTREGRVLPAHVHRPGLEGALFHVADDGESGCVVVNSSSVTREVLYCRPAVDAVWKRAAGGRRDLGRSAYLGGRLFVNTAAGDTLVVDAETGGTEAVVPPPTGEDLAAARRDYLVASREKVLRAVQRRRDGRQGQRQQGEAAPAEHYFNVYQLDYSGGKGAWTKVHTVGDAVLFFDDHGHGLSLEVNVAAGLGRDSVYFLHEKRTWVHRWDYRFLCRYSMEEGRVDKALPLPSTLADTWFLPSLRRSDE